MSTERTPLRRYTPLKSRTPLRKRRAKPRGYYVKKMADGREILNMNTWQGREAYRQRVYAMRARQGWICCLHGICPSCPGSLYGYEPTFEHQNGRGMNGAHRDDRIELPDGTWINGAAHVLCNTWKGSRRINYNDTKGRVA